MTTIAANLKGMAADSKCVFGETHYVMQKIFRLKNGSLLATAGDSDLTAPFEYAMKAGKNPEPIIGAGESGFAAMLLTADGLFVYDRSFVPDKVLDGMFAIGSGGIVALSWLKNGATPAEAVARAIEVDNNSGLPVRTEVLKGKR